MVDEDDPEYVGKSAVADAIAERIEQGVYKPGLRIPAASAIQAEFGVSRRVALDAMAELQARNLTVGSRGRGTRVRRQPPRQELEMTGELDAETRLILAELAEQGVHPTLMLATSEVWRATIAESDELEIGRSAPVIRITRRFYVGPTSKEEAALVEPVHTAVQVLDAEKWMVQQAVPVPPNQPPLESSR